MKFDKYLCCFALLILTSCVPVATPSPSPTSTSSRPPEVPQLSVVQSSQARNHIGEILTIRINRAHCGYFPGTSGKPTFCNDKPYPNHDFTMVVWEKDWSHYDGACLLVYGAINSFEGKPEIEVKSSSSVSLCD